MIFSERHNPPKEEKLHRLIPGTRMWRKLFNWEQSQGNIFKFQVKEQCFRTALMHIINKLASAIPIVENKIVYLWPMIDYIDANAIGTEKAKVVQRQKKKSFADKKQRKEVPYV